MYPGHSEDFAGANLSQLDTWVFDRASVRFIYFLVSFLLSASFGVFICKKLENLVLYAKYIIPIIMQALATRRESLSGALV